MKIVHAGFFALCLITTVSADLMYYWPFDNAEANTVGSGPVGVLGGDAVFSTAQLSLIPGTRSWDGFVDDVAIWNEALDAGQVVQLFVGTSPLAIPTRFRHVPGSGPERAILRVNGISP
ncbi:MAG: hypothetical protein ACI9QL_004202 [Candidatus Omnitrophota bacterium]|jgi:hypothetical protein